MNIRQYIVDAFTDRLFHGNPAAVCILDAWIPEQTMMDIALENNLSETAFVVREGECCRLRWFTPGGEIDLCGHATLAAAFVLLHFDEKGRDEVTFQTLSGKLTVQKKGEFYELDFPAYELKPVPVTDAMAEAAGVRPLEAWMGRDLLCVLETEDQVREARPNLEKVRALDGLLFHLTAPGTEYACVSRTFAPKCGVTEDPVCGSGHCHIVPYWAGRLGRKELTAYQASQRGGVLQCALRGNRVALAGKAVLYLKGDLQL